MQSTEKKKVLKNASMHNTFDAKNSASNGHLGEAGLVFSPITSIAKD